MKKLSKLTILITSLLTLSLATVPVYAQGADDTDTSTGTSVGTTTAEDHSTTNNETTHSQSGRQAKLTASQTHGLSTAEERAAHKTAQQQKRCENRQTKVNAIRTRIADRGQRQIDLFDTISTRVEKFYTDKGKTLSNYDQLVADVNTKHDAAVAAVTTIKNTPITLKCDGTDPKGAASSFKDALKSEIQALKDYKTAVKNLIVGVKSVQSDAKTTQSTGGTD
jgi:putative heme degradation protein